jgi:hypothetical protein
LRPLLYLGLFLASTLGCGSGDPLKTAHRDTTSGGAGGTAGGGASTNGGNGNAPAASGGTTALAGANSGANGGAGASAGTNATLGGASFGGSASGGTSSAAGFNGGTSSATGGTSSATGGTSNATGGLAGTSSNGGAPSNGGTAAGGTNGGAGRANGGAGGPQTSGSCGTLNLHPFGCQFAWGIADPGGSYANYGYVNFMSYWVDSSISASGTYTTCYGCSWLQNLAGTNIAPVYVAYIIGFLGHANGVVDGNQDGTKKLTTDGAQLIRDHRQAIVDAYAWYATQTHAAWPDKPLVWMLEGDFVQYTDSGQTNALSYDELAALAADITCAIKGNMPNAVVAIDQSSWNSDDVTNAFWGAMKSANVNYDLIWTTGVGNNAGYIENGTTDSTYNHTTAKYSYLHTLTGRTIMVDTSAGISAAGDSWSIASADDLNARMAEGVIAADITGTPPGNLESNLQALKPTLGGLPACP